MLFTERNGLRAPLEKTYCISADVYSLLMNCCNKYKKNLTHLFPLNCQRDFTKGDRISFDNVGFIKRIELKIPALYRDDFGRICTPTYDGYFDEYAILDYVEFFALNIQDISEYWDDEKRKKNQYIKCMESNTVFVQFKKEINEIFLDAGLLYELTDQAIIERVVQNSPLTKNMEADFAAVTEPGTTELLKEAIFLYKTPNPSARKDSVEKIWDALERLKTYYVSMDKKNSANKIINDMADGKSEYVVLFEAEFKTLTEIGNKFRIRHHETDKIDIDDDRYYDYFFNRCLSLIALAVQFLK